MDSGRSRLTQVHKDKIQITGVLVREFGSKAGAKFGRWEHGC